LTVRTRFTEEAEADVDEAVDLYAARDDTGELADRFLDEVARVRHLVEERPYAWPEIEPGVRQVVLRRFPFSVIYVVEATELRIVAVAHHSRRPGYWHDRR
jgi:plasmid stabilization system protein ParE